MLKRIISFSAMLATLLALSVTLVEAGPALPTTQGNAASPATTVNIQFVNHIQAKFPEQDVFVEGAKANEVVRVEEKDVDAAARAKKVYATATATPHDPFKLGVNPLGPFKKGKALGFTLGEWLNASGNGTYIVQGANANMNLSFQKLVPDSIYTVWCSRLTFPPNPKVEDHPCGAADGSQNSFKSDTQGNATFSLSNFKPLLESTKETATMIALAYHSNGKTYGANPGDFGLNSHVQLFFPIPAPTTQAISPEPSATPTPTPTTPSAPTSTSSSMGWFGWIVLLIIIAIIAIAFFSRGSSAS